MQQLRDCTVGHTIDHQRSVASTMPLAHTLARHPATRSGSVVIADEQTAGRGRGGRRWEAPPGAALLASIILKPPLPLSLEQLPMAAGLAVAQAIESLTPALLNHVGLKWPNDVLLGRDRGSAGKVAGILIESDFWGAAWQHVVVGVGINVHQSLAQLPSPQPYAPPPLSLRHFLGTQPSLDRTVLLLALCRALAAQLAGTIHPDDRLITWRERLWTLGQPVAIYEQGRLIAQGQATSVTADGSLVVMTADGQHQTFRAGDVSVRQPDAG